jgi:hypothetical protein
LKPPLTGKRVSRDPLFSPRDLDHKRIRGFTFQLAQRAAL